VIVVGCVALVPAVRFAHAWLLGKLSLPSSSFSWTASQLNPSHNLLLAWRFAAAPILEPLAYYVLWAAATCGSLMVFRLSMRRARIKPVHVVRCVVYSFDPLFWAGLVGLLLATAAVLIDLFAVATFAYLLALTAVMLISVTGLWLAVTVVYRLWTAYRLYLRFEHALLTVLASQLIAALVMVNVFVHRATWGITV
jgi:hypothetical protein